MISRSIRVAANGIVSFLWLSCIVYVYCSFFIHSSVDGHFGCVHVLAIVNCAAMHIGVHVSFELEFCLDIYLVRVALDNTCEAASRSFLFIHSLPNTPWPSSAWDCVLDTQDAERWREGPREETVLLGLCPLYSGITMPTFSSRGVAFSTPDLCPPTPLGGPPDPFGHLRSLLPEMGRR